MQINTSSNPNTLSNVNSNNGSPESSKQEGNANLRNAVQEVDPKNGAWELINPRKMRRSYSMVSSLDKLTKKLKNNLLNIEKNNNN